MLSTSTTRRGSRFARRPLLQGWRARRADYGIDAPWVVLTFVLLGLGCLGVARAARSLRGFSIPGAVLLAESALMVWSSRLGKGRVVRRMLDGLALPADARVLDVGCGRGQVLIEAAQRLPQGRAVGVDLWRRSDQSGNSRRVTLENAGREGVADRVKVHDGDARRLPFDDGCFDAVVSSLVVHNIPDRAGRADAIREMARVLRPGGRLALLDFRHTAEHAETLRSAGLVEVRRTGPQFSVFPPVRILTARKEGLAPAPPDANFQNPASRRLPVRPVRALITPLALGVALAPLRAQQVATVELSPSHAIVTAGDTIRFRVTARDSAGAVVTGAHTEWFATPFDIAAADSAGLVTTTRPGQTYVFALVGGKPGFATLDIAERPAARLEITAPAGRTSLVVGEVVPLTVRAVTALGDRVGEGRGLPGVQWRSLGPAVVEVSAGGVVRAKAVGRATVAAALGTVSARWEVTVRTNPVTSLRIRAVGSTRVGDVVVLRPDARGAGGRSESDVPLRWAVTGPGAAVYPDGRFVATEPGTYTVSATVGSRVATVEVPVLPRVDPRGMEQVSHVMLPKDVQGAEIWPVGDVAYVSTIGSEVYVFDISDPTAPRLTDSLVVDARLLNDLMTSADGKILVVSREGASTRKNGLLFYDCADPRHPTLLSEFTETVSGGVHSAYVYQHYVFATDDATGSLRIIDFADPRAPKQVARWEVSRAIPAEPYPVEFLNIIPQRYLHDVHVVDGIAYLAYWRDGLIILDVGKGIKGGSITNPKFVSQYSYNHAELYPPGYIAGTHAVFRSGDYVFLGDESYLGTLDLLSREQFATRGRMHVVDVRDLEHPHEVAFYEPLEFGVHNIFVDGGLAYLGAYDGGIRVVDVSGELRGDLRAEGRVVGGLYTGSLEGYRPNMALAWSAIPHRGFIYASDINSGLWVAKVVGGVLP